jgi:outer membrane protein assembly factor BamB
VIAIVPLWLMLVAFDTTVHAQASDDALSSGAAAASSPADWTQFHRDNMQRWNPYETALGVNNVGALQPKWTNPIGSYSSSILPSPAVVNGTVYFGSDDGNVYALNASTGAKLWSSTIGMRLESSPAVVNGVVYVGSDDDNVYALNASTGARGWSYTTGSGLLSSPAVVNGVVYIGSGDGKVYGLNANTGVRLWSFATGGVASGAAVVSSPAVVDGVVYFGGPDSNVYALNAGTGSKLWSFNISSSINYGISSSPAVADGVVYIGAPDKNVYALNARTGTKLWSFTTGDSVAASPAVANGVVYIASFDGNLYGLDAGTGAKLWSHPTGGRGFLSPANGVAVANGVVYAVGADGNSYGLSASTGAQLWSYHSAVGDSRYALISSPTIVDGVVYIRTGNGLTKAGNTYAFALGTPADLFLRIQPTPTAVRQGDLLTYAFPVWNLGPGNADFEVLRTQVPPGTIFDYIRISGTPGLGTCTTPPYQGTGQIVCHENASMAPNTTWTVRVTVKVTAPAGAVITENAATMADTPDPNMANNTATVNVTVQ